MNRDDCAAGLVRWANDVQLPPEGYAPIPNLIERGTYALCVAENPCARPGERYALSAGRVSVLEGRARPLPGEPFTSYYSRRNVAAREYDRLRQELRGGHGRGGYHPPRPYVVKSRGNPGEPPASLLE